MKMFHHTAIAISTLCMLAACAGNQRAKEGYHSDMTYGYWQIMSPAKDANGLCYTFSSPLDSTSGRQPYFMITRRASGKIEISTVVGTSVHDKETIALLAGSEHFPLHERRGIAWAENEKQDTAILDKLQDSDDMKVIIKNGRGKIISTDHYSTEGLSDALSRVKALCP